MSDTGQLKTTAAELVDRARAKIEEVDTADLIAQHGDENLVIVDIRDIRERKKGFIPGSLHAPRGMLEFWIDPESPYHKPVFSQPGARFVFHCALGWRSALAVAMLQDELGFEAAHLKNGFEDWKAQDGPIEMPAPKD